MKLMREILPYRLWMVLVAPLEVIGVTAIYAVKGFRMGVENVRDAWRDYNRSRLNQ